MDIGTILLIAIPAYFFYALCGYFLTKLMFSKGELFLCREHEEIKTRLLATDTAFMAFPSFICVRLLVGL